MAETGTSNGLSFYSSWASCPRRATLNAALKVAGADDGESTTATELGSLVHVLLERHYDPASQTPIPGQIQEETLVEANRLVNAYTRIFRHDLGETTATELLLPRETADWSFLDKDLEILGEAIGIRPFTCRIDLVTRIADTSAVARTRGIDIEPGVWIVDHKTAGRHSADDALKWAHSMQMAAYFFAWNALAPRYGVPVAQGVLVNAIYKLKTPDFATFVVRPDEQDQARLRAFLAGIVATKTDAKLRSWPNRTQCFTWNRICPHLVSGACDNFEEGSI